MYGLFTTLSVVLATLAAASPLIEILDRDLQFHNSSNSDVLLLDADIHANVMANWPSDRITTSDKLRAFLQSTNISFSGETTSVYLSDTHSWVDLNTLPIKRDLNNNLSLDLEKRGCYLQVTTKVDAVQQYWGPWHAVSSCIFCDNNPGGCSESKAYTDGMTYTISGGIQVEAGAIKAMIGFQVSYVYSSTSTTTCNAKYKDRAQVWRRNKHVWARTKKDSCIDCTDDGQGIGCDPAKYGWIHTVASDSDTSLHQNGCSAKSNGPLKGC